MSAPSPHLELAGIPAGITQCDHGAVGSLARREGVEDVPGRGEVHALGKRQRRFIAAGWRVQHEPALRLDRAAPQHGLLGHA